MSIPVPIYDEKKAQDVLNNYREMVKNIYEALRLSGMPEHMIVFNMINLPDLSRMLPENVVDFYNEVRTLVVIYLSDRGFSTREITKRVGLNSNTMISDILKEYRPKPTEVKKLPVDEK